MTTKTKEKTQEKQEEVTFIHKLKRPTYVIEPHKEVKTDGEHQKGKYVNFEGHRFTTNDPEVIDFIRDHSDFGEKIWERGSEEAKEVEEGLNIGVESMPNHSDGEKEKVKELEERMDGLEGKVDKIVDAVTSGGSEDEGEDKEEENKEEKEDNSDKKNKKKPKNVKS